MSERIRKLAEQAGIEFDDDFPLEPETIYYLKLSDFEKFAELIVRECINKIEGQRSNGENADQWTITRDLCYHDMMAGLKQHFGVE